MPGCNAFFKEVSVRRLSLLFVALLAALLLVHYSAPVLNGVSAPLQAQTAPAQAARDFSVSGARRPCKGLTSGANSSAPPSRRQALRDR